MLLIADGAGVMKIDVLLALKRQGYSFRMIHNSALHRYGVGALLVATIAGCATPPQAPSNSLQSVGIADAQTYALTDISIHSPYQSSTFSQVPSADTHTPNWTEEQLQQGTRLLDQGQYGSWRWSVWASAEVTQSWQTWLGSTGAKRCIDNSTPEICAILDWKEAFRRLYDVSVYMLGAPPLPLDLRINLLSAGTGFQASIRNQSMVGIPLELTFDYPIGAGVGTEEDREKALMQVMAVIAYELQQAEYLDGTSIGPASSHGSPAVSLKSQANSTCWALSAALATDAGGQSHVDIPSLQPYRESIAEWQTHMKAWNSLNLATLPFRFLAQPVTALGVVDRPDADVPANWGQALLLRDLWKYLNVKLDVHQSDADSVAISANDFTRMNAVLAYCQGFTHYSGDIVKASMPNDMAASTPFFK